MPNPWRNRLALLLIILSFGLLLPGVYLPVLTIEVSPVLPLFGKMELFRETRSILGTVHELYKNGSQLVAVLILVFSVVVPAVKGASLLTALAVRSQDMRLRIHRFIGIIGKWSMADVFVVGILLAYLASGGHQGMSAKLHEGFYYFLGYCLVSILSTQIMKLDKA